MSSPSQAHATRREPCEAAQGLDSDDAHTHTNVDANTGVCSNNTETPQQTEQEGERTATASRPGVETHPDLEAALRDEDMMFAEGLHASAAKTNEEKNGQDSDRESRDKILRHLFDKYLTSFRAERGYEDNREEATAQTRERESSTWSAIRRRIADLFKPKRQEQRTAPPPAVAVGDCIFDAYLEWHMTLPAYESSVNNFFTELRRGNDGKLLDMDADDQNMAHRQLLGYVKNFGSTKLKTPSHDDAVTSVSSPGAVDQVMPVSYATVGSSAPALF